MNTKLSQIFLFVVAIVIIAASAMARDWSYAGNTLHGEYVSYDIDQSEVRIRRENGKIWVMKMALLSERDQAYVRMKSGISRNPGMAAGKGMTVVKSGNRYALLIGVNKYSKPIKSLKYCNRDMSILSESFPKIGVPSENIVLMVDSSREDLQPTGANIRRQISAMTQMMTPDDMLIIAFSGHGALYGQESYLCPSDSSFKAGSAIDEDDYVSVLGLFQYVSRKMKLFVFHNFNEVQVPTLKQGGEMTDFYLAKLESRPTLPTPPAGIPGVTPVPSTVLEDVITWESHNERMKPVLRATAVAPYSYYAAFLRQEKTKLESMREEGYRTDSAPYKAVETNIAQREAFCSLFSPEAQIKDLLGAMDGQSLGNRWVNISTSSELDDALRKEDNVVLMLAPGTYNLSEEYKIIGKNLSIYGNPTDPGSVKIRFGQGKWGFTEGSRGSIIGVDVVGKFGVSITGSGTYMTLRNCVLHDCENTGICLSHGARADVSNCEIRDNERYGDMCSSGATGTLSGNGRNWSIGDGCTIMRTMSNALPV